jgi:hypothetical protein
MFRKLRKRKHLDPKLKMEIRKIVKNMFNKKKYM